MFYSVLSNQYDCCQTEVNIPEELKKAELKERQQIDSGLKRKLHENSLLRDTCQSVPFLRCYDESSAKFLASAIAAFNANGAVSKNVKGVKFTYACKLSNK